MGPKQRLLFAAEIGDPITSIHVSEIGCMAGTAMGKVWVFNFDSKKGELLTTFSDDGVRGLHLGEELSFATFSEKCQAWRHSSCSLVSSTMFSQLDRNRQNVKHVLQHGPWICILFPISTTVVNVAQQEHHQRQFKLFDYGDSSEVVPVDFDGEHLVVVDRSLAAGPVFRLVHLERNEQLDIANVPRANRITLVKLWGPDCLALVTGRVLQLYDFRARQMRQLRLEHRAEIVAADTRDELSLATLSVDAMVKVWSGHSGQCLQVLRFDEATFFSGYPYHLSVHAGRALISADEGVFLMEYETQPPSA